MHKQTMSRGTDCYLHGAVTNTTYRSFRMLTVRKSIPEISHTYRLFL